MKKHLLLASVLALFASAAFAATCTTPICKTDGSLTVNSGGTVTAESGSTVNLGGTNTLSGATTISGSTTLSGSTTTVSGALTPTGTINSSGITFSTALTGNPLVHMHYESVSQASANSGRVILASQASKKIYVGDIAMYASGAASGATSVSVQCSGGSVLATWPIALLTDGAVVSPFSSTAVTRGTALASGCPAGEAVMVSATGTLADTTELPTKVIYTWQ